MRHVFPQVKAAATAKKMSAAASRQQCFPEAIPLATCGEGSGGR